MFKKSASAARHKKKAQQIRHRSTEDDDEEDDGEDNTSNSLSVRLTETKKRRQLLTQLQYKRGVDAAEVLLSHPTAVSTLVGTDAAKKRTQTLTPSTTSTSSEGHVWDQKHKAAMEDFVQQNLQKNQQEQPTNDSEMDETKSQTQSNNSLSKEDLYQQLARKAAQLAGKPLARDERNSPVGMLSESIDTSHEVLTAGAAAAMAEVVLPVEHDLTVIAETAKVVALRRHQQQKPSINNMPRRVVPSANPAVPNRFRAYNRAYMIQQQQPHGVEQQDTDRSEDNDGELFSSTVSSVPDQDRVGFAVARQQQQNRPFQRHASERNNQKHGRSLDDRVYQQFVKRQREQH